MWQHRTRNINIEEMACIVDGQYLEEPKWWESSKTRAIEAEGLLVCRDRIAGKDTMSFTYEAARRLFDSTILGATGLLSVGKVIYAALYQIYLGKNLVTRIHF